MDQLEISTQLTVVIFGTSITSAYLSGATMVFRGITQAFLQRGWHVTFVEEFHPWLDSHSDLTLQHPHLQVLCYSDRHSLEQLHTQYHFLDNTQLVLKFSGCSGSYDRIIDEWLVDERTTKQQEFLLVYVDGDAPMRLPYILKHPSFYLHKLIPQFDGVWVMVGGDRAAQEYQHMNAQNVWVLPAAIDIESFNPTPPLARYEADLLFVGNPSYGREEGLKRLFLDVARLSPTYTFLLTGADWQGIDLAENTRYLGYIPSDQLPALYSSARLVLNVTREEMAAYGNAAALRLFEAAACQACIVSDNWAGLDQIFVPDEEILLAQSTEEVISYLRQVSPTRARQIGTQARSRVLREHTAALRINQFLALIGMV